MFTIRADGALLWSELIDDPRYGLIDPVVKKGLDKSGSLEFTMLPEHPFYNELHKMKTELSVYWDDTVLFIGRVLEQPTDFFNQRKVTAEGIDQYLNDSYVGPSKDTETPAEHFARLVNAHNAQVEEQKRFVVGICDVTDSLGSVTFKSDGYRNVKSAIDSDLIQAYKAFLRVRVVDDVRYLDLVTDPALTDETEPIRFGWNLLDMEDEDQGEDIYTVLVPLGKNNLTIESVNNGSKEIKIESLYEQYGRIPKLVNFSEANNAQELLTKANEYIAKNVKPDLPKELSITALDFGRFIGGSGNIYDVGQRITITSMPNDIDEELVLKEMEVPLLNPDEASYVFGDPKAGTDSRGGITSAASTITKNFYTANDYLKEYIDVVDAGLQIVAKGIGIDLKGNLFHITNGAVSYDGINYFDAIFKPLELTGNDPESIMGQWTTWTGDIEADTKHFHTFYTEATKAAKDNGSDNWEDWGALSKELTHSTYESAQGIKWTATELTNQGERVDELEHTVDGLFATDVQIAGNLAAQDIACVKLQADGEVFGESLKTTGELTVQGNSFEPHTLTVGDNTWTILGTSDITFNVADTQEYKDGVEAAEKNVSLNSAASWSKTQIGNNRFIISCTVTASNGKGRTYTIDTNNI